MKEAEKKYCNFRKYVPHVIALLCIPLALTLFTFPASAEESGVLFVKQCGKCHREGGSAHVVNPADKAANVWVRYFKRLNRRHPVKLTMIPDMEIQTLQVYLIKHAADSKTPYAAIIPQ